MSPNNADQAQRTPFVRRFQESVTLIEYDGRPVVVAREFGELLAYADDGRQLVNLIGSDWSKEFIPNVDIVLLKSDRLAAFKALCASLGLDRLVDKRAPALLLLTESGINLVLTKSEKPEGDAFRLWLRMEALPALYGPPAIAASAEAPSLTDKRLDGRSREARQQARLLAPPREVPDAVKFDADAMCRAELCKRINCAPPMHVVALSVAADALSQDPAPAGPGLLLVCLHNELAGIPPELLPEVLVMVSRWRRGVDLPVLRSAR